MFVIELFRPIPEEYFIRTTANMSIPLPDCGRSVGGDIAETKQSQPTESRLTVNVLDCRKGFTSQQLS
jgi:hypothetical protein